MRQRSTGKAREIDFGRSNRELAAANARLLGQLQALAAENGRLHHAATALAAARRVREQEQAQREALLEDAALRAGDEREALRAELAAKQHVISYLEAKLHEAQAELAVAIASVPQPHRPNLGRDRARGTSSDVHSGVDCNDTTAVTALGDDSFAVRADSSYVQEGASFHVHASSATSSDICESWGPPPLRKEEGGKGEKDSCASLSGVSARLQACASLRHTVGLLAGRAQLPVPAACNKVAGTAASQMLKGAASDGHDSKENRVPTPISGAPAAADGDEEVDSSTKEPGSGCRPAAEAKETLSAHAGGATPPRPVAGSPRT